uniref:Uncharacterized protein n=1 Tax=Meloidogyne floridensis TaxID=298350 RepID=A0A915NV97_9BILA
MDENLCPQGWLSGGEQCIQLQFVSSGISQSSTECKRLGAELVNVVDEDGEPSLQLLDDLSSILEEASNTGVSLQSWLVSSGHFSPEWDSSNERIRFHKLPRENNHNMEILGLRRRRGQRLFELTLLSNTSINPFICALNPLTRRVLLYQQLLLPHGAPQFVEQPQPNGYFFDTSSGSNHSFLSLPCSAIGNPTPSIRWYKNGGEEIDLSSPNSTFIVSGGALLVPVSKIQPSPITFHCVATNELGSVRSLTATIRPAFIEPFQDYRLDAYPLILGTTMSGGARLECNAPRHFPRSFTFFWVRGGSYERFVEVTPRLFISMEGTLYFAYNIREDDDSYACIATIETQSAQQGPFFRLILPYLNSKHKSTHGKVQRFPHSFAPRIDEYQPQLFPELPIRGQTVHLECFAYGFPIPTYRWTRVDGLPLPVGRHKLLSFGRILRIDAAELADSGRYRCTAQNELGTTSAELKLIIQAPPVLFHPLIDQLVAPNSTSSLHCQIPDSGGIQVEWFRNGSPLSPLLLSEQERKRFLIAGNELTIVNASPSDSGMFQCIVSNDIGSVSSSALLFVTESAPRFHSNVFPSKIFVVEGTHLSISCLVQSNPPAKTHWKKLDDSSEAEGLELNNFIDQSVPGQEIALLNIENAQALDSGLYECTAINRLGKARAIMRLEVIPRPQMSIHIEESKEDQFSKKFTCEVEIACHSIEDCPEALFGWEFNDKPIESLTFGNGGQEQHQTIRMGQRENAFKHIENGRINRLVKQQNQLELPTKFTRENVGRFACNSLFGVATVEVEPSLIFVPLKLSVGEVLDGSVKLLYRILQPQTSNVKRRDGHYKQKPIEKIYQLDVRTALDRYWRPIRRVELDENAVSSNSLEREILLEKLEPNQLYQFRLRPSTERVQYATLSDWVRTPEAVPSQVVQNLRFRMLDDHHLLLEWDPIERVSHSAPQLRFNVSWNLHDGQQFSESTTTPRIVIILPSNLKNNSKDCLILNVNVRPYNRVGPGKVATSKVVRASDKKPQRFAVNLQLNTVNSTHLNISWNWEGIDPCENVLGAKIICNEEGTTNNLDNFGNIKEKKGDRQQSKLPNFSNSLHQQISQSVPSEYNFWLFGGLLPERNYFCKIIAFDQYGRNGPERIESFGKGRTAEKAPDKAPKISFVLVKEVEDLDSEIDKRTSSAINKRGYALLLDWRPVPLTLTTTTIINESYSAKDGSSLTSKIRSEIRKSEENSSRQRGYKIFVYVTETAEQPIELTLSEAELHEPQRPSARIDGLKPMFYYSIQIAAFNPGGIGPLSEKIPVRIGLHRQQQLNDEWNAGSQSNRLNFNILFVFFTLVILQQQHNKSSCCLFGDSWATAHVVSSEIAGQQL